ncbi:MAG TPA: polysaccharide deacetylase family protein [Polyangiaceae bacterium]|nr:polysaccharide deacetylase family protein [Polyangiaceae bacterium]
MRSPAAAYLPLPMQKRQLSLLARQGAKALARAILPSSMVIWHGARAQSKDAQSKSAVALTFDDGPTDLTLEYLRVLDQLDVRATFFLIGEACAQHPDLVRAIAGRGHELANHGYTHRPFTSLSSKELDLEIERTQTLLDVHQPRSHRLVRPPHGATSLRCMLNCSWAGFTTVLWSFDSGDARNKDAKEVERPFAVNSLRDGDIILLHEGQPWTLSALPMIVNQLEEAGHELVTVGELLA